MLAVGALLLMPGCENNYRPVANPVVGPGGQPQGTHYAYVVNYNPAGDGSTTQIDVSGDSITQVQTTGLGSNYESFLSTSAQLVFVTNGSNDTVSEFNIGLTGVVTTINLPLGSHPVVVTSTQSGFMYVLNSGANSVCPNSGSISTISVVTLAVSNTTCLSIQQSSGSYYYGVDPIAMVQAAGGGRLYVINHGDNSVWVYDPLTQSIIATFTTKASGLGTNAVFLAPSADGSYIFVVTAGDGVNPGALDIISTSNYGVLPSVPLGVNPRFAFFDPTLVRLYVTNSGSNSVSVFDASNVNVSGSPPIPLLATVTVGTNPVSVTALPDGSRFFVANSLSNNVNDVSASSFAVLNTIALPVGANPVWIASEPTASKIFVANSSYTSVIQTVNDALSVNLSAPAQSPSCTSSCPLQQPVMIITD